MATKAKIILADNSEFEEEVSEVQNVIVQARVIDPKERQGGMRLNGEMKNEVIQKALDHAFAKRKKDLHTRGCAISRAAWLSIYGPAKLKHALALGEPFTWVDKDRYHKKNVDGVSINWTFGFKTIALPTHMPLPAHGYFNDSKDTRVKDEGLIADATAWQDDVTALQAEEQKVMATLNAMLARITTYPSLEKNWPAGSPFYKHLPKKYPFRHQVPAVLVSELNAALGI